MTSENETENRRIIMNEEKKLYTLLVYSENIAGILNQITAVFTRRQVNIESLNVSASRASINIPSPPGAMRAR